MDGETLDGPSGRPGFCGSSALHLLTRERMFRPASGLAPQARLEPVTEWLTGLPYLIPSHPTLGAIRARHANMIIVRHSVRIRSKPNLENNNKPMKNVTHINQNLLQTVTTKAKASPRQRMNHNFHQLKDPANRMLNAIEPESYIRPHRHLTPPKDEGFLILRGKGSCLIFDENGKVTDVYTLNPLDEKWGVDIPDLPPV